MLIGLIAFMLTDEPTTGGIQASRSKRQSLAKASLAWNMRDPVFRELFGEELDRLKIEVGKDEDAQDCYV